MRSFKNIIYRWKGSSFYLPILLMILSAAFPAGSFAQDPVGKKETKEIIAMIAEAQTPWERVELSGKLKMDGLPVSPSVKIYMERGNRIDISVRAPFVGEVGRLQADVDSILVVNKMKKNSWSASREEIAQKYPGGLELLQSLLLGQVYVFGEGVIAPEMSALFNIFTDTEAGWLLMPKPNYQVPGARYGYVVAEEGVAESLVVEREDSDDFLQLDYKGKKNGKYDLDLWLAMGKKDIQATLQFDAPKENPVPMQPITLDSKYTPLSIKEFFGRFF